MGLLGKFCAKEQARGDTNNPVRDEAHPTSHRKGSGGSETAMPCGASTTEGVRGSQTTITPGLPGHPFPDLRGRPATRFPSPRRPDLCLRQASTGRRPAAGCSRLPHFRRQDRKPPFRFSNPRSGSESPCQHPRWPPDHPPQRSMEEKREQTRKLPDSAMAATGGVASGGRILAVGAAGSS